MQLIRIITLFENFLQILHIYTFRCLLPENANLKLINAKIRSFYSIDIH